MKRRIAGLIGAAVLAGLMKPCFGQREMGAAAPFITPGLSNQVYIGFERSLYDYELASASGATQVVTSGVNTQVQYRERDHLLILGTARYGAGSLLGQRLMTFGTGAGYVAYWRRYEPFVQGMIGYSRFTSSGDMYLSSGPNSGLTTLFGAGVDVSLSKSWGVRPIYAENQYLPFGAKGSTFWNLGGGVLYHFDGVPVRRAWHRLW